MRGQIHSALRYISDDNGGGILPLSDDVMRQLKEKHPDAQEARLGSLLFGPIEDIPDTIFQEIDAEMVRDAALRTKGSGGPSGVDVNGYRRLLACKSFKKSGTYICNAIAAMAKRLCTNYINPSSIEALLSNRLILLDKGEGRSDQSVLAKSFAGLSASVSQNLSNQIWCHRGEWLTSSMCWPTKWKRGCNSCHAQYLWIWRNWCRSTEWRIQCL